MAKEQTDLYQRNLELERANESLQEKPKERFWTAFE
jgi:hypothetical protein